MSRIKRTGHVLRRCEKLVVLNMGASCGIIVGLNYKKALLEALGARPSPENWVYPIRINGGKSGVICQKFYVGRVETHVHS